MTVNYPDLLCQEIVKRACADYATAYMGGEVGRHSSEYTLTECEQFFHSEWYTMLTSDAVDPDKLILLTKIDALEKAIEPISKAFAQDSTAYICLDVKTPKGQDNIKYRLPPRVAEPLLIALSKQFVALKKELANLRGKKVSNGSENKRRNKPMKKNPGRKERRRLMFQNRRAAGKERAAYHDKYMKIMARKARKREKKTVEA